MQQHRAQVAERRILEELAEGGGMLNLRRIERNGEKMTYGIGSGIEAFDEGERLDLAAIPGPGEIDPPGAYTAAYARRCAWRKQP